MGILHATSDLQSTPTGGMAKISDGFQLHVDLLEDWLVRIALVPHEGLVVDRTWMIAPEGDTPWEGRDRLSCEGFSCPTAQTSKQMMAGERFRVCFEPSPLRLTIQERRDANWETVFEDRPGAAYQWFERSTKLKHFQCLTRDEQHYGLGDKSGKLDRSGRRLRCLQSDALGYNAETSDPLYKHAPWIMALRDGVGGGLLYDTMAETVFDLGAEHSNYFPRFRHVELHEKGMVLYVVAGPRLRDLVPKLHSLTGMPAMPPRWSLGFAFTTMHHADSEDAQQVITSFAREARERKLPISAIHLGSGYTAGADGLRYVFNWNETRFPDKTKFFSDLKAMGFRTCANIKPVLLTGHSAFETADSSGWFVQRGDSTSAIEMFWGGEGASLNFTNRDAIGWWQTGVTQQVLGAGFDAVWNDNNEAELWDETAQISGFGKALPGMECRPVHALLMTRASHEAMQQHNGHERPYTISRAGPIGIARYGETWSGDNRTSWHSLKWNLRQGLSMSLSGMPMVGHDIGGFDGPPPDCELLVRWFQMMALHPRCVMNSWKVDYDNIPNLPWMHEEGFDAIKSALRLRYQLMPYFYSLVYASHKTGHPVIAPMGYYSDEPRMREDRDSFMLGEHVLVAPVVEAGASSVWVDFPEGDDWIDFYSGQTYPAGETVECDAPLSQLPIFVRSGSVIPLANDWDENSPHDARSITLKAFGSLESGDGSFDLFWDDGLAPLSHLSTENTPLMTIKWQWKDGKADISFDAKKIQPVEIKAQK